MASRDHSENRSTAVRDWEQVKSLFFNALEMPVSGRADWVKANSHGDDSLRLEVNRLLAEHDEAGDFLNPPPMPVFHSLSAGAELGGRFRIRKKIGAGGMGEVYEADDLAGGTRVALKTISGELARNPALTLRLRNELITARNVSHPNVCKVYEYWETDMDGHPLVFFTMELLEGTTLAARIAENGRVAPKEALYLLRQIAAGLEEVHRLGIVHRDLKPSNVFLTGAPGHERAILMDFGVARIVSHAAPGQTRTGMILGTPPYMSPELLEGRKAGPASDIYSFGVLAFEMVTGASSPLASPRTIVRSLGAPWDVLLQCFDRDPAKRPAKAVEVLDLIERSRRNGRVLALAAGVTIAAAAAAATWIPGLTASSHARLVNQLTFDDGFSADPATAPARKLMVYASDRSSAGSLHIWAQKLDSSETHQLTSGLFEEDEPDISSDGRTFLYRSVADKAAYVEPVNGGEARKLADFAEGARFSPDATRVAYWTGVEGERTAATGQVWVIPANGGHAIRLAPDFVDARSPAWSPDGKRILFRGVRKASSALDEAFEWWITDANGGPSTPTGAGNKMRASGLMPHDSPANWDGSKLVFSGRTGHTFNLWSINLKPFPGFGPAVPEAITMDSGFHSVPAPTGDGGFAYALWQEQINVWSVDTATGEMTRETSHEAKDTRVSISRDGKTLAFGRRLGETRDIWVKDRVSGEERRLESNELAVPFISPAGDVIAYSVGASIRLLNVANGKQSELCTGCGELLGWMPDGSAFVYLKETGPLSAAINAFGIQDHVSRTLVSGRGLREAAVSPDGSLIAFTMRTKGVYSRLYVKRLTVSGTPWTPVSAENAWSDKPAWSDDGKTLYYKSDRDGFQCIWAQPFDPASGVPVGQLRVLRHFHKIVFTLSHTPPPALSLVQAQGKLFLDVDSNTSNIWSIRPKS